MNTVYCKLQVITGVSHDDIMKWLDDDEAHYNEAEKNYSWTSRGTPDMSRVFYFHAVHGGYFTFSYEDVLANVFVEVAFKESPTHQQIYEEEDIAVDTEEFPLGEPLKWLPF
jgi:hypothetical protein